MGCASVSAITPSHKLQPFIQNEMSREGEQACLVQALQQRAATLEAELRGLKVKH